jgi:hypothetical protein
VLSNVVSDGDSNFVPFIGITINIVWIVAMVLWAKHINTKGFTQEQKERRKRVMRSARIRSFNAPNIFDKMGSIVFEFENSNYASQFAILNQGQIQ